MATGNPATRWWEGRLRDDCGVIALTQPILKRSLRLFGQVSSTSLERPSTTARSPTRATRSSSAHVAYRSYGCHQVVDFNVTGPILADVGLRWAIGLSIDRDKLISLLAGIPRPVATLSPAAPEWSFGPSLMPARFDPVQAEALLAAPGWQRPAQNSSTRMRSGRALFIRVLVNAGESNAVIAANATRDQLSTIAWTFWSSQFLERRLGRDWAVRPRPRFPCRRVW